MNQNKPIQVKESEQTDSLKWNQHKLIHLKEPTQTQSLKLIKLYLWVYLIVVSVCSAVKLHMQTTLY